MFSKKLIGIMILTLLIAGVSLTLTRCYDDSEARVTIHLERNDLAFNKDIKQKRIIDRVLEFFSTRAEAVIGPPGWDNTHGPLTLSVTGANIENLTFSIPQTETSYSVVVPAVNEVKFEIISTASSGLVPKNWGGLSIVNLSPGEQDINITMLPMTKITNIIKVSTDLNISWVTDNMPVSVTSFNIYRSTISTGPFSNIKTVNYSVGFATQTTTDNPGSGTYFYKISVNTSFGEGVLCDSFSGTY